MKFATRKGAVQAACGCALIAASVGCAARDPKSGNDLGAKPGTAPVKPARAPAPAPAPPRPVIKPSPWQPPNTGVGSRKARAHGRETSGGDTQPLQPLETPKESMASRRGPEPYEASGSSSTNN